MNRAAMAAGSARRAIAIPWMAIVMAGMHCAASTASACPFCGSVGQSLAQRRDAADSVAIAEAEDVNSAGDGIPVQRFRVDQVLRDASGRLAIGQIVSARVVGPVVGAALLFGSTRSDAATDPQGPPSWSAIAADETLLGYVAAAPSVDLPAAERLRWFAARLEHPDASIAADAFTEFGLAPFTAVRDAAACLDAARLRTWVAEPGIDARRRGLYGLLLGVVAATTDDRPMSRACIDTLHLAIDAPADDFRAGYDGLLAGLLVAEGSFGLDALVRRGLFQPSTRPIDQRHLLAAVRFAGESLADSIPRERIVAVTRDLLKSPAVAADAVVDLARYRAWDAVADVASLWDTLGADDPLMRRAVAGYLAACPLPEARAELERFRSRNPDLLERALHAAALPLAPY